MKHTTKALIVVFAEPIDEQEAEDLLQQIEYVLNHSAGSEIEAHVEHFTELRAKKLIAMDHDRL